MIKFTVADAQVAQPELPQPVIENREIREDGSMALTVVFPMNYPDEAIKVSTRAVKDEAGKETGEDRVTSKTYGLGRNLSLGWQDNDKNLLELTAFVRARTPAEVKAQSSPETIETE